MKNKIIPILFILFTSCGRPSTPHEVDPYFTQYIQYFKNQADKNSIGYGDIDSVTVIKFKELPDIDNQGESEIGACVTHTVEEYGRTTTYKEIDIDPLFKESSSEIYKNTVFLHEMGHCAYGLQHAPDPKAIMYPESQIMTTSDFESAVTQYFNKAKGLN